MTHYLDHAATSVVRPRAIEAMTEQLASTGNASSLHAAGRAARKVVEESREQIAELLGAGPSEVIFTGGGTESDNLAIKGSYLARHTTDPGRNRIIVGTGEHHAVLDTVEFLVKQAGAQVSWLDLDSQGVADPEQLRALIEANPEDVALVTQMWVNNEIGTVQPVPQLAAIAREYAIPMHSDAVQAVGQLPIDFGASGLDLLSATGHKFGGPMGVGVLLARRDAKLEPLTHGGGQERGLRSGTLDVAAIRAFAVALAEAVEQMQDYHARIGGLRDQLIAGARALDLGIEVTGAYQPGDCTLRLPGNAHLRVPDCDGDSLLYLLDAAGIECSTGSACQAGVPQPSHVLLAMGMSEEQARGAIRLSLGHTSTQDDVDAVLAALPGAIERARRAHEVTPERVR